jgi:hypothetical protein
MTTFRAEPDVAARLNPEKRARPLHSGDGRGLFDWRRERRRVTFEEGNQLRHRHVAVGLRSVVSETGKPGLPVRCQESQGIPPFRPPSLGHAATLEDDVLHRSIGQAATHCEPCLSAADDESVDTMHE